MIKRLHGVPIVVVTDADRREARCINMLHVQTFVPNPVGDQRGTLITFANGDQVTTTEGFDRLTSLFLAAGLDG